MIVTQLIEEPDDVEGVPPQLLVPTNNNIAILYYICNIIWYQYKQQLTDRSIRFPNLREPVACCCGDLAISNASPPGVIAVPMQQAKNVQTLLQSYCSFLLFFYSNRNFVRQRGSLLDKIRVPTRPVIMDLKTDFSLLKVLS